MSRLSETRAELQADWSKLQGRWEAARELWTDEVGSAFERVRWQHWATGAPAFIDALEQLEEILIQASRENR
jgi:hypothetical protein